MRGVLGWGACLALVLIPLPAQGQDAALGCTAKDPCPWAIDLTAAGLVTNGTATTGRPAWNWTVGTWVMLSVYNEDLVAHTIRFPDQNVTVEVPAGDLVESASFNLSRVGTFQIRDAPSGTAQSFAVLGDDASDGENMGAPASSTPAPSPTMHMDYQCDGHFASAPCATTTPAARPVPVGLGPAVAALATVVGIASRRR